MTDSYTLFILQTPSDLVGITLTNDVQGFNSSYNAFKDLYREKRNDWEEINLSFVVCRLNSNVHDEEPFSKIEADVYFCRKYVISFHPEEERLEKELLRLPFIPMPKGRLGGIVRPPSAQTLLQTVGVSAALSGQIIIPGKYSAKSIASDLLAQMEPLPSINQAVPLRVADNPESIERSRVTRVGIEAFRAYRKKQEFDLDADVIVLYGQNGLGKTSFFDAIDFACTGRIGRLCRRRISQKEFVELARHLGSNASKSGVELEVSKGSSKTLIKRKAEEWNTALVDLEKLDRSNVLQLLTCAGRGSQKERIENLERLFRATHLFSQTGPELLLQFQENSTLSADLVSRALALDDYASGRAKVKDTLELLEKQMDHTNDQLNELQEKLRDVENRLKILPQPQESVWSGQYLKKYAAEIVKELRKDAGIDVEFAEVSSEAVRGWRALVESTLKDARERLSKLELFESGFPQFEKNKSELKLAAEQIALLENFSKQSSDEQKRLEEARKKVSYETKKQKNVLAQAQARRNALEDFSGIKDSAQKAQTSLEQWRQKLIHVESESVEADSELQIQVPVMEKLSKNINETQESIDQNFQKLDLFLKVREGLNAWENAKIKIDQLQQSISILRMKNEELCRSIDESHKSADTYEKELAVQEQKYRKLTEKQADLTHLLDDIEVHVKSGICPTCGIDHKDRETLIERIRAQKEARPAKVEESAQLCHKLKESLEQTNSIIENLVRIQKSKQKELNEIYAEQAALQELVLVFNHSVEQAGLSLNDSDIRAKVCHMCDEETVTIQALKGTLSDLKTSESEVVEKFQRLKIKNAQMMESRKRIIDAVEPLERLLLELRSKAEGLGFSLDTTFAEITSEKNGLVAREALSKEIIDRLAIEEDSHIRATDAETTKLNDILAQIAVAREEEELLKAKLGRYEQESAGIIDYKSLSADSISEQKTQAKERMDELERITQRVLTFERAIDLSQRSSFRAELDATVRDLNDQIGKAAKKKNKISEVKRWLTQIQGILDQQNSNAVTNHVGAFGPLTTLIQRRLRSVYGFGDVKLVPQGDEIRVEVGWAEKSVKPTDYFSDSQKQILMLSLFLAERLTQTWSGFAPILLDDPVTHFDDLNAFGFVEFIRGFVTTFPGRHQFFISTCEDRLFELMQKKFRAISGGAKFYRFEGIAADGPIISLES
jgi:exonuclease SbcC